MMVYSGFKFNDTVDMGARSNASSDEMLADSANAVGIAAYPVGSLGFGEEAATNVVVEVIDVVYGTNVQCANCGNANDGSQFIYIVTRANVGSPAAPGQVVYSLDGGTTWANSTVTGIGNTNQPTLIDIAGNVLFIVAGSSLFYSVLDDFTGAPTTWQTVTMPAAMLDVYVQAPTSIWYVSSTSIYKATDITIAPTLVGGVIAAGIARVGSTVTASATFNGTPTPAVTYQWLLCATPTSMCIEIGGATSASYETRNADIGSYLLAKVTATNAGG
jgi:hypothetical protein